MTLMIIYVIWANLNEVGGALIRSFFSNCLLSTASYQKEINRGKANNDCRRKEMCKNYDRIDGDQLVGDVHNSNLSPNRCYKFATEFSVLLLIENYFPVRCHCWELFIIRYSYQRRSINELPTRARHIFNIDTHNSKLCRNVIANIDE